MNKIEITKQLYDFAIASDWDGFRKHIHPDFAVIESEGVPYAGNYKGVDGFQELVHTVFTYFDKLEIEATHYMEGDDHVVVIVSISGKGKNTGKAFESNLLELFRFKDNKVIEIRPYYWDQQLIHDI